jgi:NTE family protein
MDRLDLGLCLSGGGYRAMLFHVGAVIRLNETGILGKIDLISSVSGGSIAAGILAANWSELGFGADGVAARLRERFVLPALEFSKRFVDAPSILGGLVNPFSSAADLAARAYDRHLFGGKTLQDLPDRPRFVFCASNLGTGSLFRFSKRYIADYRIGLSYNPRVPLAVAVAASAGFPPFLSPLRLDLTGLTFKRDDMDDAVGGAVEPPSRVVLTDGGVYDNHGIEPAIKRCRTILVSDAGAPWKASTAGFRTWLSQLKRVMHTTDNQVRALRRRDIVARFIAGAAAAKAGVDLNAPSATEGVLRGTYWSVATDPDKYPATKPVVFDRARAEQAARVGTWLHFLGERESEDLVNWGYFICDVALRSHYDAALPAPTALPIQAGTVQAGRWPRMVKRAFELFG